jgi:hypothetical protein
MFRLYSRAAYGGGMAHCRLHSQPILNTGRIKPALTFGLERGPTISPKNLKIIVDGM